MGITSSLSYLLITVKLIELEKISLINRDNLTIPIQMQLSQKQKTISDFFAKCLKSRLNFKHFDQKVTPIDFPFSKLRNPKT